MTKARYSTIGQLKVLVYIEGVSFVFGTSNTISGQEYGTSTSNDVKSTFNKMLKNAILDAIYQFSYKRQLGSNPNIVKIDVLNYDIVYNGNISIKRVNFKGKYYTVIKDKETKKVLHRHKYTYKSKLDTPINIYD